MRKGNSVAVRKSPLEFIVKYGVYSIFLVMFIVFSFSNKNFLTKSNILLLLEQSAPLLIGVIGITFVLMDGGTDISAGSNMYLSAAVGAIVMQKMCANGGMIDTIWE